AVGNLIKSKGFDLLIRSVRDLRDEGLKARVLIVGRGPEQQFLEDLVRELGLEGQVRLYGPLPHGEVRSLYYDFDLFALPSHNETFGMVYLEAAWAGIPSIGVRGQGIWGLFDQGSEALFMEPGDQASLTDLMRQLIIDPELRKRMGRNAKTKCEREFRLERVLAKMKAEYKRSMS
ncbi:MAG TPA: glycosyltransferase family 4 protein, partial [Bacteroidales bacterium]|nr:glycosyltransferase family 4 protein [Bacteroidales bacterium]